MVNAILLLTLFAVVAIMVWLLDPNLRRGREFRAVLSSREPVPDDEMFHRHFAPDENAPEIPGRVRGLFAEHMHYPADKLLPDDDLLFFWNGLDMIDLIHDLERVFGIELTAADVATVPGCTIRAVSHLVFRKASGDVPKK